MIKESIQRLVKGEDLTYPEASEAMKDIMSGIATEAQIGAFLTALTIKKETIQEISAFALAMREYANKIYPKVQGRLVDTCGTGGDKLKSFNISTISAFIVAGAGIAVAKHGNRSVTSKSGSADLLEILGLNLNLKPKVVEKIIEEIGIGFMFAPNFHPAMKHALGPRKEIGIRTIFNILGPLTNPASVNAQVLGVASKDWLLPLAYTLKELGCIEAMVVHGVDGLDEISIIGKTMIAWLKENEISMMEIMPGDYGLRRVGPEEIKSESPEESAILALKLLNNFFEPQDPKRNIVLFNAAAGMIVANKADDFEYGIELAEESIKSGNAYKKLEAMIKASGGQLTRLEEFEEKYD